MDFVTKASAVFPPAHWTGQSSIHVSIANGINVPESADNPRKALAAAVALGVVPKMREFLSEQCPSLEWLLGDTEFQDLLYVDYSRMLHGEGAVSTPNSLKNPATGNVFHRVALCEEHSLVAGIRVWVTDLSFMHENGLTNFGFRMRIEEQNEEAEDLRARSRKVAAAIEDQLAEIKEYVAEQDVTHLEGVTVTLNGAH